MGRQPFAPFRKRHPGGAMDVGTHSLRKRPELESIIANCLMAWPPAEAEMALILAQLLGSFESEAALAVYHSLRRSSAQRDAISEAARHTLDNRSRELLSVILAVHKSIEDDRNDLTHGHFGTYSNLLDGILWMGTKAYVDLKTRLELANQVFTDELREETYERMYFYKKDDLERIFESIKEIASIWSDFQKYLRASPALRDALYDLLCARPRILQELENPRRKNTPQAPV
jgi:hypothetical protein